MLIEKIPISRLKNGSVDDIDLRYFSSGIELLLIEVNGIVQFAIVPPTPKNKKLFCSTYTWSVSRMIKHYKSIRETVEDFNRVNIFNTKKPKKDQLVGIVINRKWAISRIFDIR